MSESPNDMIRDCRRVDVHRPWPRVVVDEAVWRRLAAQLRDGETTLSGLWGDAGAVDLHIRGCAPTPVDLLRGLLALMQEGQARAVK